jgi:2-polyprenyl-3-methyl-5-hydroxy-6-metoxy-1,4-benzoquinol methylase
MRFFNRFKRFGMTASHDRSGYREYQEQIGRYYLQHFVTPYSIGKKIIDVGCGEGGVLTPFEQEGYQCTGLEYSDNRVEYARINSTSSITFLQGDIQEFSSEEKYDIVLMLDVIEHLLKKLPALKNLKKMKSKDGIVIISFPPFRSPFGGHQQVMSSFLKYIPYIHLLPELLYRWSLEKIERKNVALHLHNFKTGMTISQFEALAHQAGLTIIKKKIYFVRPRQALRFNMKIYPFRLGILAEYLSTGVIYILK